MKGAILAFSFIVALVTIGWAINRAVHYEPVAAYQKNAQSPFAVRLVAPTSLDQVRVEHIGGIASKTCWLYYPNGQPVLSSDAIPTKDQNEFRAWCK